MTSRTLVLRCVLVLGLPAAASCGGDDDGAADSALTECQQLESALCERTTECAVQEGLTKPVDREVFAKRCLGALTQQLSCQQPSDELADFELCIANIREIPCDIVATNLDNEQQLVVPSSSCADYFAL